MAQHDYVIANGTGAAVRSDLNNGLAAIVTQNSGATEPTTTYAFMRWADTTAGVMKMRNSANSAWITLYQLDGEWTNIAFENGTAAAPSIYFKDSGTDTGFYSPGANQVGISTGGTARLTIDSNGNVDIDSNTLYVDATNNRVGLGTSSPSQLLEVHGTAAAGGIGINITNEGDAGTSTTPYAFINARLNAIRNGGEIRFGRENVYGDLASADSYMSFYTAVNDVNTERLRITSGGLVGIGTTSPGSNFSIGTTSSTGTGTPITLDLGGTYSSTAGSNGKLKVWWNGTDYMGLGVSGNQFDYIVTGNYAHVWYGNGSERARIDSSGRLLVGTSTSIGNASFSKGEFVNSTLSEIYIGRNTTTVANGNGVGQIHFSSYAGSVWESHATIACLAGADSGSGDKPGTLTFSTTADGASSPTERLRIAQNGAWGLAGANYGSSGQVLTSNGSSSAPTWSTASGGITLATSVATTSGTSVDFTSIPSTVKAITVMYSLFSTNGNGTPRVQLGTSSGVTTSGYTGTSKGSASINLSSGFDVGHGFASSNNVFSGQFHIRLLSSNTWTANGMLGVSTTGADIGWCSGTVTLGGTLDRIRFTNTNGDTFDAGSVNIMYES
jgi:hypothetical protein